MRNVTRSATPSALAFFRATATASAEMSDTSTCQSGRSQASVRPERAAAGADVDGPHELTRRHPLQGVVDDQFGLRTRNQDVRIDQEIAPVELARADDVGDGLALRPTGDERVEGREELGRRRLVGAGDPGRAVPVEDVTGEHFGVEVRVTLIETGGQQALPGGGDGVSHVQASTASVRLASLSSSDR